jgi:hypothetical protein
MLAMKAGSVVDLVPSTHRSPRLSTGSISSGRLGGQASSPRGMTPVIGAVIAQAPCNLPSVRTVER